MDKFLSVLRSVFFLGVALLCSTGAYHLAICTGNSAKAQMASDEPAKVTGGVMPFAFGKDNDGMVRVIRVDHMGRVIVSPQSEDRITRNISSEFRVWAEAQTEVEIEWR